MNMMLVAMVTDDADLCASLRNGLADTLCVVIDGRAGPAMHERIRALQPHLVIVDIAAAGPGEPALPELLADDPATQALPVLLCSDDSALLPSIVKPEVQAGRRIQGASRDRGEILCRARLLLGLTPAGRP